MLAEIIVGEDEDDCDKVTVAGEPPPAPGARLEIGPSFSLALNTSSPSARDISEADLAIRSCDEDEPSEALRSRTKWTGICQSESSVNGFLPSNVFSSSLGPTAGPATNLTP